MKKRLLLFLVCFLTLPVLFAKEAENFYFSNLNLKDGLSQISVLKIMQDSKGFIWCATRNGLNRYDGNRFVAYKHSNTDSLSLSDNHITTLAEDKFGNLWIGTSKGLNRLDLKTNKIKSFNTKAYPLLYNSSIRALLVDSRHRLGVGTAEGMFLYINDMDMFQVIELNGQIKKELIADIYETTKGQMLIGTKNKGLYVCDMNMKPLKHFTANSKDKLGILPSNNVATIFEDSKGQIWGGATYNGLFKLDIDRETIITYTKDNSALSNNSIRCIAEVEGTLLVGTFDGLYTIDLHNNSKLLHSNASLEQGNLSHFSIYSLFVDRSNIVWVGTYAGGINYSSKYNNRFVFHDPTTVFDAMFGIYGTMVCMPTGCLYMATEGRGILDYNLPTRRYQYYPIKDSVQLQHSQNIVKELMLEGDILWCGTNRGGIYQFNIRTKKYSLYYQFKEAMSIYSILRASNGDLWLGAASPDVGLIKLGKDKSVQNSFKLANDTLPPQRVRSVRCMMELRPGVLLVGTRNDGLVKYDEWRHEMTYYSMDEEPENRRLQNNYITSIVRDASGNIWIGMFGGGLALYDEEKGIISTVTQESGLAENDVCAIVPDEKHNLWISTSNGISRYNIKTKECANYNIFNGVAIQEFTPHSGAMLPNGDICFSGNNGFVTFTPDELQQNSYIPPLVLTGLVVNNEEVEPGASTILTSILDDTEEIRLKYNQNNISISYCALNYIFPEQNQYAIFLEGHDKEWNYIGNRKEAYYTNLSPGTYIFEVKGANNDGIWNEQVKKLRIIITPPLWKTWYAYLFYVVVFLSMLTIIMYYILNKQKLERELVFKQKEKFQLEEFHQTKLRLFTNFSHELRTPLTLVIAPLQELMQMADFSAGVKNKLSLIFSNAQRLLLLVNQLMDLRKNQDGKMQLRLTKSNIRSFMLEICCAFNQIAMNKNINFVFDRNEEHLSVWFDKSLFEKVVFNLLSNAFKFTNSGGEVSLDLRAISYSELPSRQQEKLGELPADTNMIRLLVTDTGKGIPTDEIKNIFTPFYQVGVSQENNVGTGIGLSLTQSIVNLHHGIIEVASNEPHGTIFEVIIPVSKGVYDESCFAAEEEERIVEDVIPPTAKLPLMNAEKKWTVLLAEDNNEVRNYVKECLEPYYYVLEADNGEDAFNICVEKYPDLILSDIMMPRMDGLELCTLVKKDLRVGHIPVVLMTAKSMVVHIKEGFSVGADDYIVKPFNMDVLLCRINNLLEAREKLKKLYGKKFSPEALGIEIVSTDDRFTQKFFEIIEKNIANPNLNIDLLSKEIGLSRANLYRKLKAITELSPTELIRNKRLEVAAKLLVESDYTVSEISVLTGFNSHAYFSNSFKLVYGYSPSEFVMKHREGGKIPLNDDLSAE